MIPSIFVWIDAIPRTPNGKVDRGALPAPGFNRPTLDKSFIVPRDALELDLAHMWEHILGIRSIGVRDDFFELGGHSLMAIRLMANVQRLCSHDLPLGLLFQARTIEQLSMVIRQQVGGFSQSSLVAIQPNGSKRPFFCVHPATGIVLCYTGLARHLDADRPFYGLQAQGLEDDLPPLTCIEDMAAQYITVVQQVQQQGPYLLGGWSMGGVVAFEMAQQLRQQGQQVALLTLLDSFISPSSAPNVDLDDAFLIDLTRIFHLSLSIEQLRRLDPNEQLQYFLDQVKMTDLMPPNFGISHIRRYLEIFKINIRALEAYVPQPYSEKTAFFQATERVSKDAGDDSHKSTLNDHYLPIEQMDIYEVSGDHSTLIEEPQIQKVAETLRLLLDELKI
jgi:thioesterase domain-containing protein